MNGRYIGIGLQKAISVNLYFAPFMLLPRAQMWTTVIAARAVEPEPQAN